MSLLIECAWFNVRFAYVARLVLEQSGPTTMMTLIVILTRPYVRLARMLMKGLYLWHSGTVREVSRKRKPSSTTGSQI